MQETAWSKSGDRRIWKEVKLSELCSSKFVRSNSWQQAKLERLYFLPAAGFKVRDVLRWAGMIRDGCCCFREKGIYHE